MPREPSDSFVFYRSFLDAINEMNDSERLEAFEAICNYAIYGKDTAVESPIARVLMYSAKPLIDSNREKRENGKKGGRPKIKPKEPDEKTTGFVEKNQWLKKIESNENENVYESESESASVSENVYENASENDNVSHKTQQVEDVPFPGATIAKTNRDTPTLDDVIAYAESRGRVDLAEQFFDYYNAADWFDSNGVKVTVRNWKQKFISWEMRNQKKEKQARQKNNGNVFMDMLREEEERGQN